MAEKYRELRPGDLAPWFVQESFSNPNFRFDTVGGRFIMLCFLGSAADPHAQAALEAVHSKPEIFDDDYACFFAVTSDPTDRSTERLKDKIPGYRNFLDADHKVGKLYGSVPEDVEDPRRDMRRMWVLLSPDLKIVWMRYFSKDRSDIKDAIDTMTKLPPLATPFGFERWAPVLILPNVFDKRTCDMLINFYQTEGGQHSGVMREVDGRTVGKSDARYKVRADVIVEEPRLKAHLRQLFQRRVIPEIKKAHQFDATWMERYLVACYDSEEGGHFVAHRDNTTKGTAHRQFAASVNLNDDFDGGEVGFPEYGTRRYKPPAGGAVVFSCSLLHSVSAVTRGARYAFLPFLYNDASSELRKKNEVYLDPAPD